jgi:O-antigen/teichoic acid export membrane protein
LVQRTLRSGVWVGISSLSQNVLQTVRSVILARLLTPEIFGLMGICLVLTRGLDLFTETGIGPALIHRQDNVDVAKNTAFTLQIVRGFLLAVLTVLLAPFAAAYYNEPRLREITYWLAAVFVINGLSNIDVIVLQKKLDFRRITALDLTVAALSTTLVVGLAVVLRSVWALVIGQIVTSVLRVGLSYLIVPTRPSPRFDKETARELFRYGRYITGLTIVLFITSEIDNLAVGKILGLEQLGIYTLAYSLANLPATHISKVASSVVFPAYSSLQNDLAKLRIGYLTMVRLAGGIAIPAAVGLAVLAPEIVRVVYGPKWLPMVDALRILTLFGAARAVGVLGGSVYNAVGRPSVSFYMSTIKLAVILVLIYPAAKQFGLVGAALAVAIPQVVGDAIGLFIVQSQIGLPVGQIALALFKIVAASAVMGAVVVAGRSVLGPVGLPQLLMLVSVGIATYALLRVQEIRSLYAEVIGHRAPRRPVEVTP